MGIVDFIPKDLLIRYLVATLGEYLIKPKSAAKYAKYLLRGRDYLLLLFPLDIYPLGDYTDTTIAKNREGFAVPKTAVDPAIFGEK